MCLVSVHPYQDGFILASNRDESPSRSDTKLAQERIGEHNIYFPKDVKGGSWIICSDLGWVICLLNGAFQKHKHLPPYHMSRGVIIKQLFEYKTVAAFIEHIDLTDIEPFTSVILNGKRVYEFCWDGMLKNIRTLDPAQVYVWSSCTLYTPAKQDSREEHFRTMLGNTNVVNTESIRDIHLTGSIGDVANDFVMNRENRVKTISQTVLSYSNKKIALNFLNLENQHQQVQQISLRTKF